MNKNILVVRKIIIFLLMIIPNIFQAQTAVDISSNLSAYWKFDEIIDTTVKDFSGNYVTGVLRSGAAWTTQGKINSGLSLESINSFADFGTSNLQIDSELTVSFWIFRRGNNSVNSFTESLLSRCQYGYPFLIQLENSGYVRTFIRGTGNTQGAYVNARSRLQNNVWNHVALTYKDGQRTIYINGAVDTISTSNSGGLFCNSGGAPPNIRIGSSGTGSNSFWGMVDEVRIYNRALAADEISALYDGTGLDTTPPLPVATVNDGTGNDMATTGSLSSLSANWTASSDPQSNIVKYYYAIGTIAGGTDITDWTDNKSKRTMLVRGLNLHIGSTYYISVKAENSSGLISTPTSSDGIRVVAIDYSNLIAQDTIHRINNPIDLVNYPQELPPLEYIVNKPLWDVPSAGLFTWRDNWSDWHVNNNSYTNEIHQVGWKAIRVGSYYNEMMPDDEMDNLAIAARNDNVKVMFTLIGKPRYETGEFTTDQQWIDSCLIFFDKMIGRFGPHGKYFQDHPASPYEPILYWEIWNEPDLHYMTGEHSTTTNEQKADLYSKLLIATNNYIRAHHEWDDIKIVAMSIAGVADEVKNFADLTHSKIQANGGNPANCYDVLSIHPYTHDCPPDIEDIMTSNGTNINYTYSVINETAKTREVMSKWGNGGKPLWFTEVGWGRSNGAFGGSLYFPISEEQQAAYLCRLYAIAMRLGIDQVHYFFIIDADGHNAGCFNSADHTWYKSGKAAQNFISLMPAPKIVSAISDGELGYYAYRINPDVDNPDVDQIIMAWNAEVPMTVNFPVDPSGNYLLLDMLGNSVSISPQNGQLEIPIGPYPVYIVKGNAIPTYVIIKPPEELKTDSVTTNQIALSWMASTSPGIAGYTILRDGEVRATTIATTFTDLDFYKDSIYSYSVKAFTSGNVSSRPSNEVRVKSIGTNHSSGINNSLVPGRFIVYQNYPNPFNQTTMIRFIPPADGFARVKVFNCLGQIVARPFAGKVKSQECQSVPFDGGNLSSGVYFYSVEFGAQHITRKLILLK